MRIPEILAPAGDSESMDAALAAGADAVYFGLSSGFNARARAKNFLPETLADTVSHIHACGAKAHITFNTLIFESELKKAAQMLEVIASSGADAIIVQDLGAVYMARKICPELPIHASTQMTVTSLESAKLAKKLGITRIVLPRELNAEEIAAITAKCGLETEVFILGALCMSFSGQCLASLAWGGRSANRGECAQACRLPYTLIADGKEKTHGYLMSPLDLAGFEQAGELASAGVSSFKIEGRLKSPQYVYFAVKTLKQRLQAEAGGMTPQDLAAFRANFCDLSVAYSRGFGSGYFSGINNQTFINKECPKHHGVELGTVESVQGNTVLVKPAATSKKQGLFINPQRGMGVLFMMQDTPGAEALTGGPIFDAERSEHRFTLRFGRPGPDLSKVRPGDRIFVTGSPHLTAVVSKALKSNISGRIPLHIKASGKTGEKLTISAACGIKSAEAKSEATLQPASKRALSRATLEEKLSELGGTPFVLHSLDTTELEDGLFLPMSELKPLRRALIEQLDQDRPRTVQHFSVSAHYSVKKPQAVTITALCRTISQLEASASSGADILEADLPDIGSCKKALALNLQKPLYLALPKIHKDGEEAYYKKIADLNPYGLLIRSLGAAEFFCGGKIPLRGDYSLNAVNSLSVMYWINKGLESITAGCDLSLEGAAMLAEALPPDKRARLCLPVYLHIPAFHTQYCLFAANLSKGKNNSDCGMPCAKHDLKLRDRLGFEHPVRRDTFCRNTVFDASPRDLTGKANVLKDCGISSFKLEFLNESPDEIARILANLRKKTFF
ncbi:MAG: U32 family peptidase [bacterium]|nr:U32 family peptidase [bacterium]